MKTKVTVSGMFQNNGRQVLILENQLYFNLDLQQEKEYEIEIKEWKSSRTKRQNALMWAIIHELSKNWHEDDMDIYCKALQDVGAKYEDLVGTEEIENSLRKSFRAVKILRPIIKNRKKFYVYRCFMGSSKFNREEMSLLIDKILEWAEGCGINTDYYIEMMG